MELFKIENLTFKYPLCPSPAVNDVSLSIVRGEFAVVCGATGSGKSTLLRLLKREIAPMGDLSGSILYKGIPLAELDDMASACDIGFVMQDPQQQIVTDKVWHELAFGLENIGLDQNEIAIRVAETASYFGIENWYDKNTDELSGGQKQLLNLASVMTINPSVLILDEPTSQLDPIAASDFINTVKKLNLDFSLTVIIVEHRLEEIIPVCDRMIVLQDGRITHNGSPAEITQKLLPQDRIIPAMPSSVRLYHLLSASGKCPLTVREGREFITENYGNSINALKETPYRPDTSRALELNDVYFRYERESPDILKGVNLTVYQNEIFCILGGNGSGKTTTLCAAAGILKPYCGCIKVFGKKLKEYKNQSLYKECLSMLPQDVTTVFMKNTVREELGDSIQNLPFDISHLYGKHPYDLSGGEQQLTALAKVLSTKPRLLLADEPTKGLDADKKAMIIRIFRRLKQNGITVVIVTHDVEFAASCADRCALFFRGQAVSVDTPETFFSENRFYTTAASRMSRGYYKNAVTVEQVAEICRLNSEADVNADNQK